MNRAIVVGANGFIGSAVVRELLDQKVAVIAIVHNDNRSELKDHDCLTIKSYDGTSDNLEKLLEDVDADVMYYFAWEGVSGKKRFDEKIQLDNIMRLLDTIYIAKKIGCSKFISSGSIMECESITLLREQQIAPGLGYIYGAAKVAAHLMAMPIATSLNIDLCWAQITNTYGPGEKSERLINSTIRKCLNGINPEFTSGTQNYDFIYITDVAHAFYLIGMKGKSETYLIGSNNPKPLRSFLEELNDVVAPNITFNYGSIPYTGVDLPIETFDNSISRKVLGFNPSISFKDGCIKTINWIKLNER